MEIFSFFLLFVQEGFIFFRTGDNNTNNAELEGTTNKHSDSPKIRVSICLSGPQPIDGSGFPLFLPTNGVQG